MKAKHQRLTLVAVAVVALIGAALLAMLGLRDQAAYFYQPEALLQADVAPGTAIRLGATYSDIADTVGIHPTTAETFTTLTVTKSSGESVEDGGGC